MKKLVLIRHAEAEPALKNQADFDRPLTKSGKNDAAKMAAILSNNNLVPELTISSPVLRALTTANIFMATFGLAEAETNVEIYEADANVLLNMINQLDNQYNFVALVGHNPSISNLLYFLTQKITTMPTCALVEIDLPADAWAEVSGNTGNLIQYQYP